jgi:hypothetical protein
MKLRLTVLLVGVLLALLCPRPPVVSAAPPPPRNVYQTLREVINVTDAWGDLRDDWELLVQQREFDGWWLKTGPYLSPFGTWYVIMVKTVRIPAVPLLPRIGCDRPKPLRPPNCPVAPG